MSRLAMALALAAAVAPANAASWSVVSKGVAAESIGLAVENASSLFLAGGGGSVGLAAWVAKSADGGATWAGIPGVDGTTAMLSNDVAVSDAGARRRGRAPRSRRVRARFEASWRGRVSDASRPRRRRGGTPSRLISRRRDV